MFSVPAPAKLNLFLHITAQRPDGYHDLQTCFHLLDHGDRLDFAINNTGSLTLQSAPSMMHAENLVLQAASLLQQFAPGTQGVDIKLDKVLPLGAGLGGGSSDAASTLLALNTLWGCGLNTEQLAELGLALGADVPVFVRGHSGWAEGVGEKLTVLPLPQRWYLVVTPPCRVSTAEIFSHGQLTRNTSPITIPAFPFSGTRNDCEAVAVSLYPEIGAALEWLNAYATARMTGTGSSIFADFDSKQAAEGVLRELPDGLSGFVAQGINTSPVLQAIALIKQEMTG